MTASGLAVAQEPTPRAGLPTGSVKTKPVVSAIEPGTRPTTTPIPKPAPRRTGVTATASGKDVVIPLEVEQAGRPPSPDKLHVGSGTGKITSAADGAPQLEIPLGGTAVLTTDAGRSGRRNLLVERTKTALPWLLVEAQAKNGEPAVRTARPFVTLAKAILWNPDRKRHIAQFLFGLDPESGPPGPLEHELSVRFTVTCDDVAPADTRVKGIGPSGYSTVSVECSAAVKNERPEHELGIFVERDSLRYPFKIPRRAGPPTLTTQSNVLIGFGFSSATLTLSSFEEDGSPFPRSADTTFQLLAQGGRIDASEVTIPTGQQQGRVTIHPHGFGKLDVVAALGDVRSQPLSLTLGWPIMPLFAIFFGGTLGGFAMTLRDFKTALSRKKRARAVGRRVLEGTIVGFLASMVSLFVPSITTLPSWAPRTELGLFVIAMCGGILGAPLLRRLAESVFPTPKEE